MFQSNDLQPTMRIYEAVVASSAETLDGQQGFGLVRCSRSLPAELRREARNLGYSDDAGRLPIYAFKRIDVDGKTWLLLNCAVHTVDYTGRASHVSHTIAFLEEEWSDLMERAPRVPSPIEFIRKFAWVSEWETGRAKEWIEEGQDQDLSNLERFLDTPPATSTNDFATLLAFEYPQDSPPLPRKILWKCDSSDPHAILDLFHEAWTGLDPWRGERPYGDLLDEPPISIRESWRCSFTTNLRHGRPDPFLWIASSPDCTSLQGREVLDLAKWKLDGADSIKQVIGARWGDLLISRKTSARDWANAALHLMLEKERIAFENKVRAGSEELTEGASKVIAEMKHALLEEEGTLSKLGMRSEMAETRVREWRDRLSQIENRAKERGAEDLQDYRKRTHEIRALLGETQTSCSDAESTGAPGERFLSEWTDFEQLEIKYKQAKYQTDLDQRYKATDEAYKAAWRDKESYKEELEISHDDLARERERSKELEDQKWQLQKKLADVSTNSSPRPRKSGLNDWRNVTLIVLVVILAGLAALSFVSSSAARRDTQRYGSQIKQKDLQIGNLNKQLREQEETIRNQSEAIRLQEENNSKFPSSDAEGSPRTNRTASNPNPNGQAESQPPNQEASRSKKRNAANSSPSRREVENSDNSSDQTREPDKLPEQSSPKQDEAEKAPHTNESSSKTAVKVQLPAQPKTSGTKKPTIPK